MILRRRSTSVGGNLFLKINKTGGDLLTKKSRIRTSKRENIWKRVIFPPVLYETLEYTEVAGNLWKHSKSGKKWIEIFSNFVQTLSNVLIVKNYFCTEQLVQIILQNYNLVFEKESHKLHNLLWFNMNFWHVIPCLT